MNDLCPKCNLKYKKILTKQRVIIDKCEACKTIWLEKGELNFFAKNKKNQFYYRDNIKNIAQTNLKCPKCLNTKLVTGNFIDTGIKVEKCEKCEGLLFDQGEVSKIITKYNLDLETKEQISGRPSVAKIRWTSLPKLPSLGLASIYVIGSQFLVIFVLVFLAAEYRYINTSMIIPISTGLLFLQYLLSPIIMDVTLRWFNSLEWISPNQLPKHLEEFVENLCKEEKIPFCKFGIINDGALNAFTYGHVPGNARIVLTRGILNQLQEDEIEAVVAHEIGHIVHWDFILMTLAQLIPTIFHTIYRSAQNSKSTSSTNGKGGGGAVIIAMVAYLLFFISQYLVLYLSRIREYWADQYSGIKTKNPNSLIKALVKISFGHNLTNDSKNGSKKREPVGGTLGICNISKNSTFNLYAAQNSNTNSIKNHEVVIAKEIMKWDLWNPWAIFYELQSTHPLTAKRINSLGLQARHMKIGPIIDFDLKKPESYWDEFGVDLLIYNLPVIGIIAGVIYLLYKSNIQGFNELLAINAFLPFLGIGLLLKFLHTYPRLTHKSYSISTLLKLVKISGVRSVPVKIKGKILGRGDPGYIFSEDFVIQDSTGLIYLDYQQPLRILDFFFSITKASKFHNTNVIVEGWYRRAPVPYIEIYKITSENGVTSTCKMETIKKLGAIAMILLGIMVF